MDELKPCPFCGAPAELRRHKVVCTSNRCGVEAWMLNAADSIRVWNTRPREDAGVVDEWRPIECYPNDSLPRLFLCRGKVVQGFKDATGQLCVQHELGWRVMRRRPSHWRELPPGPTAALAAALGKSNG